MSYRAIEWRVEHPLTGALIARILLRQIDGVDYFVAVRDVDGGTQMIGSWDYLAHAHESVLALYERATGDTVYGDDEVDRYLKPLPETPFPAS